MSHDEPGMYGNTYHHLDNVVAVGNPDDTTVSYEERKKYNEKINDVVEGCLLYYNKYTLAGEKISLTRFRRFLSSRTSLASLANNSLHIQDNFHAFAAAKLGKCSVSTETRLRNTKDTILSWLPLTGVRGRGNHQPVIGEITTPLTLFDPETASNIVKIPMSMPFMGGVVVCNPNEEILNKLHRRYILTAGMKVQTNCAVLLIDPHGEILGVACVKGLREPINKLVEYLNVRSIEEYIGLGIQPFVCIDTPNPGPGVSITLLNEGQTQSDEMIVLSPFGLQYRGENMTETPPSTRLSEAKKVLMNLGIRDEEFLDSMSLDSALAMVHRINASMSVAKTPETSKAILASVVRNLQNSIALRGEEGRWERIYDADHTIQQRELDVMTVRMGTLIPKITEALDFINMTPNEVFGREEVQKVNNINTTGLAPLSTESMEKIAWLCDYSHKIPLNETWSGLEDETKRSMIANIVVADATVVPQSMWRMAEPFSWELRLMHNHDTHGNDDADELNPDAYLDMEQKWSASFLKHLIRKMRDTSMFLDEGDILGYVEGKTLDQYAQDLSDLYHNGKLRDRIIGFVQVINDRSSTGYSIQSLFQNRYRDIIWRGRIGNTSIRRSLNPVSLNHHSHAQTASRHNWTDMEDPCKAFVNRKVGEFLLAKPTLQYNLITNRHMGDGIIVNVDSYKDYPAELGQIVRQNGSVRRCVSSTNSLRSGLKNYIQQVAPIDLSEHNTDQAMEQLFDWTIRLPLGNPERMSFYGRFPMGLYALSQSEDEVVTDILGQDGWTVLMGSQGLTETVPSYMAPQLLYSNPKVFARLIKNLHESIPEHVDTLMNAMLAGDITANARELFSSVTRDCTDSIETFLRAVGATQFNTTPAGELDVLSQLEGGTFSVGDMGVV